MNRLTIGLGIAVIIFILLGTVACGGSDGALAKGGINMIVMSGKARIQADEGDTSVVEGQEAVITAGDQIMAGEAGVKLLLADGSSLYLSPDTDLQVITFSSEGTARLRSQLKGRLEVEAASPLLTVEISTFVIHEPFAVKTIQFKATPTVRDTTFELWIDGLNAHLAVEAGEVNVTHNDRTATISAGREAILGGELVFVEPTATADLTPTSTPGSIRPSPTATATPTAAPNYLYPAPGLVGPGDGSDFKPNEDILLIWAPTPLSQDEWYEVQLWREGEPPKVVQWVQEGTWKVERKYCPDRCQWRIRIVRGQEGKKERDLSPPSQTWSFSWLSPVPMVQTPVAEPSPPISVAPVITVYLRGTNNAQGFATLRGDEHVDAGMIYTEGAYVYGNVAVRIGDMVYHSDEELAPEPKPLPAPYRLEVKFSDSLLAATEGMKPGFDPQKAQFWVGELDCNSHALDKLYKIEMTLYAGGETRKRTEVSFLVENAPPCGDDGEEPGEGRKRIEIPFDRP